MKNRNDWAKFVLSKIPSKGNPPGENPPAATTWLQRRLLYLTEQYIVYQLTYIN